MKFFKKLSTVAVAAVMGCSLVALTACNPDGDNGGDGVNGGDNSALLTAVLGQEIKAASAEVSVNMDRVWSYYGYTNGAKGDKLPGGGSSSFGFDVKAAADLVGGDADVTHKIGSGENTSLFYVFARGGNVFELLTEDGNEVTDFSEVELEYLMSLDDLTNGDESGTTGENGSDSSMAGYIFTALDFAETLGDLVNIGLDSETYVVMAFADAFGGLSVSNGTATADLNKALYNFATEAKAFAESVNLEMTVADVLGSDFIKGLVSPFANAVTPSEFVDAVKSNLEDAPEGVDPDMFAMISTVVDSVLLEPNAGETTYDYIVRVVGSEELLEVANEMLAGMSNGQAPTIENTLDKLSLKNALELGGMSLTQEQFEAMVATYVEQIDEILDNSSASKFVLSATNQDYETGALRGTSVSVFEGVVFTYTLSGNTVTAQSVSADISMTEGGTQSSSVSDGSSTTTEVKWGEYVTTIEFAGSVTYSDTVSLKDITNCAVVDGGTVKDYLN